MATTATITPTLGSAPVTLQAGNYSAIDDRRAWGYMTTESVSNADSYKVIQRAAGANMTVDVQSSSGEAVVTGDSVAAQGNYTVPRTAANINVDIAAADATNPRNDLVVLEVKDDQHDAGGLNLARVRVITGTPNASAALTDVPGANGTPALPSSCKLLAVVRVTAAAASVTTAMINDRRVITSTGAWVSWTPSFTGGGFTITQGNATSTGAYMKIGRSVFLRAKWTFGSSSSFGAGSGGINMDLPITSSGPESYIGLNVMYFDSGIAHFMGHIRIQDSTNVLVSTTAVNAAGTYATQGSVSATVPFTWSTNDIVWIGGTYEAAA